jgi:hypothetical protein
MLRHSSPCSSDDGSGAGGGGDGGGGAAAARDKSPAAMASLMSTLQDLVVARSLSRNVAGEKALPAKKENSLKT